MSDTTPTELAQQGKELHRAIDFGFQVEAFLLSDIGKYLTGRAEELVTDAAERLKTVDPENPKAIRELQNKVAVGEQIQYWLAEAIQAGHAAQDEFIDQSH